METATKTPQDSESEKKPHYTTLRSGTLKFSGPIGDSFSQGLGQVKTDESGAYHVLDKKQTRGEMPSSFVRRVEKEGKKGSSFWVGQTVANSDGYGWMIAPLEEKGKVA